MHLRTFGMRGVWLASQVGCWNRVAEVLGQLAMPVRSGPLRQELPRHGLLERPVEERDESLTAVAPVYQVWAQVRVQLRPDHRREIGRFRVQTGQPARAGGQAAEVGEDVRGRQQLDQLAVREAVPGRAEITETAAQQYRSVLVVAGEPAEQGSENPRYILSEARLLGRTEAVVGLPVPDLLRQEHDVQRGAATGDPPADDSPLDRGQAPVSAAQSVFQEPHTIVFLHRTDPDDVLRADRVLDQGAVLVAASGQARDDQLDMVGKSFRNPAVVLWVRRPRQLVEGIDDDGDRPVGTRWQSLQQGGEHADQARVVVGHGFRIGPLVPGQFQAERPQQGSDVGRRGR